MPPISIRFSTPRGQARWIVEQVWEHLARSHWLHSTVDQLTVENLQPRPGWIGPPYPTTEETNAPD